MKPRALRVLRDEEMVAAVKQPVLQIVNPVDAKAVVLRAATPADVEAMHSLLEGFAKEGLLLPRAVEEVYRNFREFVVAEHNGQVVGCAGLRLYSATLGEIVGLAVSEQLHGGGVGRRLIAELLKQAEALGLLHVFALTLQPGFFHKLGFKPTHVSQYPQKITTDCSSCAKRAVCIEIAVSYEL